MIKQREKLKEAAKDLAVRDQVLTTVSEEQEEAWAKFTELRNKITSQKRNEEHAFKSGKVSESLASPSATWSTAKAFMGWKTTGTPHQLEVNNVLVTKASMIAKLMNEYFISKVKTIRNSMNVAQENLSACLKLMIGKNCSMKLNHVTKETVKKLLKNLKNSRSTSVDELDNYSVKLAADYITDPLHHIVTLSIMQSKFPSNWKYTKVIPLHKKDSQLECKNYRPVAILSPLSKVLEKIVYMQIYDFFTNNRIFHPNLHGYRKHRSTQTALLQMYDRWVRAAAQSQVSGVVLIDLSAAFDLVDSNLLLKKMKIYGLEEDLCAWIGSYLHNRYQSVWIDHVFSEFVPNRAAI